MIWYDLMPSKGVFTPALFSSVESNSGAFSPLVQFVWEGVNILITLGCGPKQPDRDLVEEVVSKQTLMQFVCGANMI